MRLRLLTMGLVDRALYALNLKSIERTTHANDRRRAALLGTSEMLDTQTQAARTFAKEVASKLD